MAKKTAYRDGFVLWAIGQHGSKLSLRGYMIIDGRPSACPLQIKTEKEVLDKLYHYNSIRRHALELQALADARRNHNG